MEISDQEFEILKGLEEGLWRPEVRFDVQKMENILALDFFEFGRSSRVYGRSDILDTQTRDIPTVLPLPDFDVQLIDRNVTLVTYTSIVYYEGGEERARRSSIWLRTSTGWQLRFHQGTPIPEDLWI